MSDGPGRQLYILHLNNIPSRLFIILLMLLLLFGVLFFFARPLTNYGGEDQWTVAIEMVQLLSDL